MDPLTALGLVGNIVQVVDFTCQLISKSSEIYKTGGASVGVSAIEAATTDLKTLNGRLQLDAKASGDAEIRRLCQSCDDVADKLLKVLKGLTLSSKKQIWGSIRKALKTVMNKGEIDDLDRTLAGVRQQLDLRISVDIREKLCQFAPDHSEKLAKLDSLSKKIFDAILRHQDVFEVELDLQFAMISLMQRQEQHANSDGQEKQLAKLPYVPQAAFNSIERQHDPLCLQDTRVDVLNTIKRWTESPGERHIFLVVRSSRYREKNYIRDGSAQSRSFHGQLFLLERWR